MKALLIGCGNIGALYDWETDSVKTYAKALNRFKINFEIYDTNIILANKVAKSYGVNALESLNNRFFSNYDLVIISSPTKTHYSYLNKVLDDPPKLIICEKPVDTSIKRLNLLESKYKETKARILVNYHRRFIPKFDVLSQKIREISKSEKCTNITITYQRGFHNNGSHAIDLLTKLFGVNFSPENSKILKKDFDEFKNDPTCSIFYSWNKTSVFFIGLANSKFSHFEISIYFSTKVFKIMDGGDKIEFYSLQKSQGNFYPFLKKETEWNNVLDNYMLHTINLAKSMLADKNIKDNFLNSIMISKSILSLKEET